MRERPLGSGNWQLRAFAGTDPLTRCRTFSCSGVGTFISILAGASGDARSAGDLSIHPHLTAWRRAFGSVFALFAADRKTD